MDWKQKLNIKSFVCVTAYIIYNDDNIHPFQLIGTREPNHISPLNMVFLGSILSKN